MLIEPGNVFAVHINSHSQQWDGSICTKPESWECGADEIFRIDNCGQQFKRCFHLNVFGKKTPRLLIPDNSVCQRLRQSPTFLNDQILILYGGRFSAIKNGTTIKDGQDHDVIFGLYRIQKTYFEKNNLVVEPYPDGWALFPRDAAPLPFKHAVINLAYIKQVRAKLLTQAIQSSLSGVGKKIDKASGWTTDRAERLQVFSSSLPQWLEAAEKAAKAVNAADASGALSALPFYQDKPLDGAPLEGSLAEKLGRLQIKTVSLKADEASTQNHEKTGEQIPATPVPALAIQTPEAPVLTPIQRPFENSPSKATKSKAEKLSKSPKRENPKPMPTAISATISDMGIAQVTPAGHVHSLNAVMTYIHAPLDGAKDNANLLTEFIYLNQTDSSSLDSPPLVQVPMQEDASVEPTQQGMRAHLPEPQCTALIERQFGTRFVLGLRVAFGTKPLVILTGAPGAGKSWLACHILDDEQRDRSVIVPVASTWRGREDLLGYVNPINGLFEPTEFTEFLLKTQSAWESGDQRPRLVIFEEFNISQPEHWLSDLLVRLEYHQRADRTVSLGGAAIVRHPGKASSVFLAPSLSFVATINNDHTVKPLSPRVLDRAALLEVESSGQAALRRMDLKVSEEIAELIEQINDLLSKRGAAFSVRSALSLQIALNNMERTGLTPLQSLDAILAQEVFSRVRLSAGDPLDEALADKLSQWVMQDTCVTLLRCSEKIIGWKESLRLGCDVFQA